MGDTMKKTHDNLVMVNSIFVMSLLVANIVASKVVDIFGLIVPAAVVAYGITFLCTDIINEKWGAEQAKKTVKMGLIIQLFSAILILLAIMLPPAGFMVEYSNKFHDVLSQNIRIVIASLVAYFISQTHDVVVFNFLKKKTDGKHKWARNNISTMTSQFIDTSIFITIAFYGVVPNLIYMIISQYIIKFIISLLDTPFFYLFTRGSDCNGKTTT
jgi:hypothetical protein